MATIYPEVLDRQAYCAGAAAEIDVLRRLEAGLSDAFSVFHSVQLSSGEAGTEQHGEIDLVVVNQAGDLLLLEVKAGGVEFRADGLFKRYGRQTKNVTKQIGWQYASMRARLQHAGLEARVHHLLVLPDVKVRSETVQWPRERIVDCDELDELVPRVLAQLGPGLPGGPLQARVLAFLENRFDVAPDVSALSGRLQHATVRLSSGLATWVPRMSVPSGLIRVDGTAGSGKTQLALRLLREAAAAGQRASYLCFNRALADHMARVAPAAVPAETFHEYAARVSRRAGLEVDFGAPGVFDRLAAACVEALQDAEPDLYLLVLDEGQDLQPELVQALLSRLRPQGRGVLLEDPNQQLYADRVPFDLPDATTITSHENYRSPRAVVRLINLLGLCDAPIAACSAYEGEAPDPILFEDDAACLVATQAAVQRCLERGFAIHDVAVVSLRGRERSLLQRADQLGPWSLRRFSGRYDAAGAAIWTTGALLVDSVRRFKGQAAPAVVFTECDIDALSRLNRRLLFVGLTRARMHLEWVVSRRCAAVIRQAIGEGEGG